jgi:hypothetical protein
MTNTLLNRSGSPASTWLLCILYVCFILNHTVCGAHNDIPMTRSADSTHDISPLLRFYWWEDVLYHLDGSPFPFKSPEGRRNFVGIAKHVGHAMTYKILTADTKEIIFRSSVLTANSSSAPNLRTALFDGEMDPSITRFVKSKHGSSDLSDDLIGPMPVIELYDDNECYPNTPYESTTPEDETPDAEPQGVIGRTFLLQPRNDGQRFRARIVKAIEDQEESSRNHPQHQKFLCSVNNEQ